MRGQITVAEIVYTNSVFMGVMGSIAMIVNSIPTISETLGAASKAYSELVVPIDVKDVQDAKPLDVPHGKIDIKNLSFKYKRKNLSMHHIIDYYLHLQILHNHKQKLLYPIKIYHIFY